MTTDTLTFAMTVLLKARKERGRLLVDEPAEGDRREWLLQLAAAYQAVSVACRTVRDKLLRAPKDTDPWSAVALAFSDAALFHAWRAEDCLAAADEPDTDGAAARRAVRQYWTCDAAEPDDVLVLVDTEHEAWHYMPAIDGQPAGWCNCDEPDVGCFPTPWPELLAFIPLTVVRLRDATSGAST